MKKALLLLACMLAVAECVTAGAKPDESSVPEVSGAKPNVVLFFIDDMGYADTEPFGAKNSRTPEISKMATEGIRFTSFYNGWINCSPSRASLMTGCYAGRIGLEGQVCFPNKPKALNPDEHTMAEMFKTAGYTTGIFGKWHLGHLSGYLPPSHGFDEFWGIPYSNDMWPGDGKKNKRYPPLPFIHNETPVAVVEKSEDQALLTEAMTRKVHEFIRNNYKKPFFAYIPYSAVHGPQRGHPDFLAKLDKPNNYVAQVEEIDTKVGETLELLRELKIERKTIVIFLSDNGGVGHSEKHPLNGGKGGPGYEGNMRTPLIAWWPENIPAGTVSDAIGNTVDLLPTFAALCGGKPSERKIDGRDISDLFLDPKNAVSPHTVARFMNNGVRRGQWKLLRAKGKVQLFDLDADIGETKNLAEEHPELVKELLSELDEWNQQLNAEKRPNAQMNPCGPLVTDEEADKLPRLVDWMKRDKER